MKKYINKGKMSLKVNSEEAVKNFIRQCQDLVMGDTKDQKFKDVYITKKNAKKLLTFIDCISKRENRNVLSHAMVSVFESFVVYDVEEVVREITKVNGELRVDWKTAIRKSVSRSDITNTFVRLLTARHSGDILGTLSKYASKKKKNKFGMKIDNFVLNSPYGDVSASLAVYKDIEKKLESTCETFKEKSIESEHQYYLDDAAMVTRWYFKEKENYNTNEYVNSFFEQVMKSDTNVKHDYATTSPYYDILWEMYKHTRALQ